MSGLLLRSLITFSHDLNQTNQQQDDSKDYIMLQTHKMQQNSQYVSKADHLYTGKGAHNNNLQPVIMLLSSLQSSLPQLSCFPVQSYRLIHHLLTYLFKVLQPHHLPSYLCNGLDFLTFFDFKYLKQLIITLIQYWLERCSTDWRQNFCYFLTVVIPQLIYLFRVRNDGQFVLLSISAILKMVDLNSILNDRSSRQSQIVMSEVKTFKIEGGNLLNNQAFDFIDFPAERNLHDERT